MRKYPSLRFICLTALMANLLLTGCLKDKVTETYAIFTPVYTLKSSVLAAINGNPGQAVAQPGQIYTKGSFIYLNDLNTGIHIIDNSDPTHPVQTAYLNIPGNQNIAIRGNILYADMYADLLAIDISNPQHAKIIGALWSFFTSRASTTDTGYVLTSWSIRDTTFRTNAPSSQLYAVPGGVFYAMNGSDLPAANAAAASTTATGTAGSTATMTLIGDYLYAIPERHSLGVVNLTDSTHPAWVSTSSAGFDLETIFPLQNRLLLGSMEGVYVYSIDNPAQPVQLSEFQHGTSCDPVIADQDYAYVTLHSGTSCGGAANELDVLSAQDITQASLVKTYPMTSPSGLSKDGSMLFVCDGASVKAFNAADPTNLQLLTELNVSNAYDVISANNILLIVSTGGLYQYNYSDPNHIVLLSYLPVKSAAL